MFSSAMMQSATPSRTVKAERFETAPAWLGALIKVAAASVLKNHSGGIYPRSTNRAKYRCHPSSKSSGESAKGEKR